MSVTIESEGHPWPAPRPMCSVKIALAVGLALTAIAVGVVLSHSPLTIAGTNSIPAERTGMTVERATSICQGDEVLPQGTSAIRVSLATNIGPRLTLKALASTRVITYGERDPGWGTTETVTIPVKRVSHTVRNASICLTFGAIAELIEIQGTVTRNAVDSPLMTRLRIEYLRAGHRSWWSMASSIARRMGMGHAPGGAWVVFLLIVLMAAAATIASWAILRTSRSHRQTVAAPPIARISTTGARHISDAGSSRRSVARIGAVLRRIPGAGWACALVVCLSAACWSNITPPFQAPDEPAHFAYVQQLAETGSLPTSSESDYSEEENVALLDLHHQEVRWHPEIGTISSPAEQQRLQEDLAKPLARSGGGGAGVASSQPPLYYALETIPYYLGEGGTLLDRLELMRLLSALMAGVTTLFAYLFIREALPRAPWAWTVGGLGVAFTPLLGFTSGTVNPDVMLCAVSSALFYCLARGFRRGLTPRLAIAIGALTAIGFLTKLNFIGLVPGVMIGLVALALRGGRASKRTAWRSAGLAVAVAASPVCVYMLVNLLSNRPGLGEASTAINLTGGQGSVFDEISYIWQLYLPQLPGMRHYFSGVSTTRQVWFGRSVGLYGWLDTPFPVWVYNIALVPAGLIAVLAIRALVTGRTALRHRLVELAVYLIIGAGVMTMIGAYAFLNLAKNGGNYTEPRYLLPMLALLGALLALAARGAGRRWGPAVGALIVVLFFAHDLFSQLQVIARYYG